MARRFDIAARLALGLALLAALPAVASRVPAPGELDDITATVIAYAKKHSVAKNPQVTGVRVSTKGPYARATAKARGADPATVVLKTKGSGWKVLQLGTDISCDVAPARVMKDLRLDRSCAKN